MVLLYLALGSMAEVLVILATLPDAFVGGILAFFLAGETWNLTQTRSLLAEGRPFPEALR